MRLRHLSLTNFRKFTRLDLDFPQRAVLLTGANAQGKTTVLEAIYFLAAFTSFQTNTDRQLINFTEADKKDSPAVARLIAEYQRGARGQASDAFSLAGFSAALDAISRECPASPPAPAASRR